MGPTHCPCRRPGLVGRPVPVRGPVIYDRGNGARDAVRTDVDSPGGAAVDRCCRL